MNNQYYVVISGNEPTGPYARDVIEQMIKDGKINADTLLWDSETKTYIKIQSSPVFCDMPFSKSQVVPDAQSGVLPMQQQQSNAEVPSSAWLVDPSEKIRFSLKNGFLTNAISSEGFINEDAIITDKRLYYNVTSWNLLIKNRTEMKIDLDDITATTITDSNPYIFLIIGAILFFALFSIKTMETQFFAVLAAVISVLEWVMMRKTYFKIEYAGGSSMGGMRNNGALYFSVKEYGMDTVRAFQKEIHLAKAEINRKKYKL